MSDRRGNWRMEAMRGLLMILAVGVVSRVAFELITPILPLVIALLALGAIYWLILGRRR